MRLKLSTVTESYCRAFIYLLGNYIRVRKMGDEFSSLISTRDFNSQPSAIQSTALPVELSSLQRLVMSSYPL
jgi:hypothetical protein